MDVVPCHRLRAERRVFIPPLRSRAHLRPPARGSLIEVLRGATMGTTWSVKWIGNGRDQAAELRCGIQSHLDCVVAQMSPWEPASDLCRFNAAPAGSWCGLPGEFFDVLETALDWARRTDGAFDPAVGDLVDAWGFGPGGRRGETPAPDRIASAARRQNWRRLRIDAERRRVQQPGGVRIDLCGIAKGFAVDRIADWLPQVGIRHFLVEIGGELRGEGVKADGTPWWVAFADPARSALSDMIAERVVALHGMSIATSGDAYHYFVRDGERLSHTIDPATGRPVAGELASVTVLSPRCTDADALATALTVLGPRDGLRFAEAHGVAASFVARTSSGLKEISSRALLAMLA